MPGRPHPAGHSSPPSQTTTTAADAGAGISRLYFILDVALSPFQLPATPGAGTDCAFLPTIQTRKLRLGGHMAGPRSQSLHAVEPRPIPRLASPPQGPEMAARAGGGGRSGKWGARRQAELWILFQAMLCPETTLPVLPRAGPGLSQEAPGSELGIGMSPPGGSGENSFNPAPLQTARAAQLGVERKGRGPGPWGGSVASTGCIHTPSPQGHRGPSVERAGKPQPPGEARSRLGSLLPRRWRSILVEQAKGCRSSPFHAWPI